MATIWAAHHELIGRDVAIKVTDDRSSTLPAFRTRFLNEARAVGRLRHPNVVDVLDFGELQDRRLYIVFELLEGSSLGEFMKTHRQLSESSAVKIAVEICRGLQAAHAA